MPSSAEHQAKYFANRTFLNSGAGGAALSTVDPAWAVIVAFYAALHLVDRLAARQNLHFQPPGAHGDRLRFVSRHHYAIYGKYNDLKIASEIARYGTINQFNRAFPGNSIQTILIDQNLVTIENHLVAVFTPPSPGGGGTGASGT